MAGMRDYNDFTAYDDDNDDEAELARYNQYPYPQIKTPTRPNYQYVNSERDFTLPLQKHKNFQTPYESPNEDEISIRKYLDVSVSFVSILTENLLSHPFVVIRRQCQVHHSAKKFHLTPLTLIKPIIRLHQRQGITTLWKGLGSCLLVRGMTLAVEDVITKITPWPKKFPSSCKQIGQHILLKSISFAVVIPFYAASLVETVQSDIASEKVGFFDVFRDGAHRLLSWSSPQNGRMLPVWALVGPSVSLGLSKYMFGVLVHSVTTKIMESRMSVTQEQKGAKPKDITTAKENIQIYSALLSMIMSETLFYPLETILHRLQLQGTRTIIDNLDSGSSVIPILTSYEGAIDCYKTTIASEGYCGLYKGFGSIVLQFAAHFTVIKITKWVVIQIIELCSNKPPTKVTDFYSTFEQKDSHSTSVSRSFSNLSE